MDAAVDYLAGVGRLIAGRAGPSDARTLREDTRTAMTAIQAYEQTLSLELLGLLRDCGAEIYGIGTTRACQRGCRRCASICPGLRPRP